MKSILLVKPVLIVCFIFICCGAFAQFTTEEKTLVTQTGDLKGTLVKPEKLKKFNLIIIQPGSGPTDRNGNNPMGVKANSYRLLAEALAKRNIATLLIDKRGIAASTPAGKSEANLRFDDYINDLAGWVQFIKKDSRIKKIFLAGHSEGSLIAMVAAQKEKVKGYISISGAGEPIDKIIVRQVNKQSPELATALDSMLMRLKNGEKLDTVPTYLLALLRPSVQPYMASWMKYNPCEEIQKLSIPTLILQGTTDIQVEAKEAEALKKCNPKAELSMVSGMNHILKEAPADRTKNMATYNDVTLPLMRGLADMIAGFIQKS